MLGSRGKLATNGRVRWTHTKGVTMRRRALGFVAAGGSARMAQNHSRYGVVAAVRDQPAIRGTCLPPVALPGFKPGIISPIWTDERLFAAAFGTRRMSGELVSEVWTNPAEFERVRALLPVDTTM